MRFGIMQGRLSPPQEGRLQFFPRNWAEEFPLARHFGFETIEWICEDPIEANPLADGRIRLGMRTIAATHGIAVESLCADVFMTQHLTVPWSPAIPILESLLLWAREIGVRKVGIPLLEAHTPKTPEEQEALVANLGDVLSRDRSEIELALEIDLPANDILSIVEKIGSSRVGVCYDTGNAMSSGFDAGADIRTLGPWIKEIHMKDRMKHTPRSVILGQGSVDFPDVFKAIREIGFDDLIVLQAWRTEDYLGDAARQFEFIRAGLGRS